MMQPHNAAAYTHMLASQSHMYAMQQQGLVPPPGLAQGAPQHMAAVQGMQQQQTGGPGAMAAAAAAAGGPPPGLAPGGGRMGQPPPPAAAGTHACGSTAGCLLSVIYARNLVFYILARM
jgi:hypothetical protein